jgi:hypothetical protein
MIEKDDRRVYSSGDLLDELVRAIKRFNNSQDRNVPSLDSVGSYRRRAVAATIIRTAAAIAEVELSR